MLYCVLQIAVNLVVNRDHSNIRNQTAVKSTPDKVGKNDRKNHKNHQHSRITLVRVFTILYWYYSDHGTCSLNVLKGGNSSYSFKYSFDLTLCVTCSGVAVNIYEEVNNFITERLRSSHTTHWRIDRFQKLLLLLLYPGFDSF